MKRLSGKIYWIEDDFNFNGIRIPKENETSHVVTNIENVVIDENVIKFNTAPLDYFGKIYNYNVNLLANDNGFGYIGKYTEKDRTGEISCELFENKKIYFIYGKWEEDDVLYTWWARIQKNINR